MRCDVRGGAVKARVIRPLIEHFQVRRLHKVRNRILGNRHDAKRRNQFLYAVIDLGIDVIRSASKHHDGLTVRSGVVDKFQPALNNGVVVRFHCRVALLNRFFGGFFGNAVAFQRSYQRIRNGFGARHINIRIDEVVVVQFGNVGAEQFRVIRHDQTIVVIVAVALVGVVTLTRIENEVNSLFE